ncbi:hypothetical protein L915_00476 [Phytophthora nicotianae]|uniref:Uncharacterized protein n=1 Tax=Phytophthora nicotianae TaxID=4792 RepID=W2HR21_PHYNI|nr:hypothetical protein L915_00476 [Phytophthora nicotianae]ETL50242.1 hypothetical protein L916_00479 [Phytophthora nicotianae]
MASYSLEELWSFTPWPTKVSVISESRKVSINLQAQQLKAQDHRTMETHQSVGKVLRRPVGEVLYLPDGGFYVQACPPGANFCPGADTTTEDRQDGMLPTVLMDIETHDSDDEEMPLASSSASLLNAIDIDSDDDDDDDEPVKVRSLPSLLDAVPTMDSDDEQQPNERTNRSQVAISGAALDLFPIDLTHLSDLDSSSSSEEESDSDSDSDETESDDDDVAVGRRTVRAPRVSLWESDYQPVADVDLFIRANMAVIEAKKPWRFVFRCLAMPFSLKREEDPFDVFFMRWDDFWLVHGRAVWERDFWQPLVPRSTEYYRRKWRQNRAQLAFRDLATDLVKRLGEDYPRALALELHEGWWYRTEVFPLRRLFFKNHSYYEEYLATQVKNRWPRGIRFLMERGPKPLWWLSDSSPAANNDGK